MASEAQIRSSLQILSGNLNYSSKPTTFQANVDGSKGPVPGAVTISTAGTDISFAELIQPALCRVMNLDDTNFVEWGIWDGTDAFFPLGEILPGESYVLRLSRNLGEEFGVGTGTTEVGNNSLRFKADTASVEVLVEAFEA